MFTPGEATDVDPAALVALEVGDNEWEGTWTHEPRKVWAVRQYIAHEL